jgi:hypothetical protein
MPEIIADELARSYWTVDFLPPPAEQQRKIVALARSLSMEQVHDIADARWGEPFKRCYAAQELLTKQKQEAERQVPELVQLQRRVAQLEQYNQENVRRLNKAIKNIDQQLDELLDIFVCKDGEKKPYIIDLIQNLSAAADKPLVERIAALEQKPSLRYCGIYSEQEQYRPGDCVSRNGSIWHCNAPTFGTPPGDGNEFWTLCVKAGRDGRHGKDAIAK